MARRGGRGQQIADLDRTEARIDLAPDLAGQGQRLPISLLPFVEDQRRAVGACTRHDARDLAVYGMLLKPTLSSPVSTTTQPGSHVSTMVNCSANRHRSTGCRR